MWAISASAGENSDRTARIVLDACGLAHVYEGHGGEGITFESRNSTTVRWVRRNSGLTIEAFIRSTAAVFET